MLQDFNLLYVEDEKELRDLISITLNKLFNQVYTAENGKTGLDLYKNNIENIDLIITDINMPVMSGMEMAQEIRALSPEIPIIITTAHNDNDFLHEAINLGITSYLLKPVNLKKLFDTVSKVLEAKVLQNKLEVQKKENLDRLLLSAKFSVIGQLAAGLTHEINTPLTYIKGALEMLELDIQKLPDSTEKSNMEEHQHNIASGINRIVNIVTSMKESTSSNTEEKKYENIYETIIVAVTMTYNKAKYISDILINGESFVMNMDKNKESYRAKIQKQRVEQAWIIIINNALDELIKLTNYDERKIEINIKEEKETLSVKFIDNAGGIKDEIIEDIFEPFKSTKESSGIGIGLSIAKKVIEDQNGTIKAYNENNGAVFEVTLPRFEKNN